MTFAVKICGLSTPETLDAALQAGADTVGFVFHPRSPRNVGLEQAASLVARTAGHARTVDLIVDMPPDQARALCASVRPDLLQLHGRETPQDVAHMRAATGLKIIKAVGVAGPEDMAAIAAYRDVASRLGDSPRALASFSAVSTRGQRSPRSKARIVGAVELDARASAANDHPAAFRARRRRSAKPK